MVLVTGPTGSGKTSTLYAFLMRIGSDRRNVVNLSTIEDPIDNTMPRVNQVPVNPAAGMDFANGLRALLRQDPDVIMVGEIRDRETADTASWRRPGRAPALLLAPHQRRRRRRSPA